MITSLLPCNCVMFVYIAYNLVMLLFFFFIPLPFMVNKRFSKCPKRGYNYFNTLLFYRPASVAALVTQFFRMTCKTISVIPSVVYVLLKLNLHQHQMRRESSLGC